jgi:formylglycine-generating enzyme required for sulfatase activity
MGKTPVYRTSANAVIKDSTQTVETLVDATKITGSGFRLPTEKEWEYAARGGVPSAGAPWTNIYAGTNTAGTGASQLGDFAWYSANSGGVTHPVKTKSPNKTGGLYDMSGNVWEWCWDVYLGTIRVIRGGSWSGGAAFCTVAYRNAENPDGRHFSIGFRVASP